MYGFIPRYAMGIVALLASVLVASCDKERDPEIESQEPAQMRVGFRIALGGTQAVRTTPAGDYDDATGVDFENYIDVAHKNYRILFFDTENRYLTSFRQQDFIPLGDDPVRSKVYEVIGRIDGRLPRDFKVVVLANWPTYPEGLTAGKTTIEDICTAAGSRYAYVPPFVCSEETPIPMYGVRLCEAVEFTPQTVTYLGTVHLLRAMAKVQVVCPAAEWTLEKVRLKRYNRTGYCAPSGVYAEGDYVKGDHASDYVEEVHVEEGAVEEASIDFRKLSDGSFEIYLPEHRNADGKVRRADAAQIVVKFEERADKEYVVDFKYYGDPPAGSQAGDPFDVRRNCYYKFKLSNKGVAEPSVSVDVYPYDQWELRPGFGVGDEEAEETTERRRIIEA
ncbi:MAG: hypothetical protein K2O63_04590 [Alistipes sp.]|nr:hypothetical protein [Alistipes sp.]